MQFALVSNNSPFSVQHPSQVVHEGPDTSDMNPSTGIFLSLPENCFRGALIFFHFRDNGKLADGNEIAVIVPMKECEDRHGTCREIGALSSYNLLAA